MSVSRVLVAGVLGGVAMYVWMSVAHVVLPLGRTGISEITNNEPALLAQMQNSLGTKSGLYLFPALDSGRDMKLYEQKLAANPSGLLVYYPPGQKALTPGQLITEFVLEIIEGVLAAIVLAQTRYKAYWLRVGFVTTLGVLAALPTNVAYWNWYGFPPDYTLAYTATQIVGFFAAGLVAAAILRPQAVGPA